MMRTAVIYKSRAGLAHLLAVVGALLLLDTSALWAQALSPNVVRQIEAISAEKALRTPEQRKIDSQLLYASRAYRGLAPVPAVPEVSGLGSGVEVDHDGRTLVISMHR